MTVTTDDTLQRTHSDTSQKSDLVLRLGDKDSDVFRDAHGFGGDDGDVVEIKVETTVHSDLELGGDGEERSTRGRDEVEVTLPRMRYGYPQVQTPDGYGRHPYAKNGNGKGSFGH